MPLMSEAIDWLNRQSTLGSLKDVIPDNASNGNVKAGGEIGDSGDLMNLAKPESGPGGDDSVIRCGDGNAGANPALYS